MGAIIGFPSPSLRPWVAFRGCWLLRLTHEGGGGLAPPPDVSWKWGGHTLP